MSTSSRWPSWWNSRTEPALKPLGRLERAVMEKVWEQGEISVGDLQARHFPQLAYTTVMTTLDRLFKKGLLQRRKEGRAFLYDAPHTREQFGRTLAQQVFGGLLSEPAEDRAAVLSSFVEVVSEQDAKLLDELERVIEEKRRLMRRPE